VARLRRMCQFGNPLPHTQLGKKAVVNSRELSWATGLLPNCSTVLWAITRQQAHNTSHVPTRL
jgi:hypothetical protein